MKRMITATVLVLLISTVAFGRKFVADGKTHTAFGNYKIELADNPVNLKGTDCKAYIISYENSPMEVTVVVSKERNCKRYVVLSDKLSVQYVCNKDYFGVARLDKSFEQDGCKTSDSALNKGEYFHQKVLGPGQKPELEATQLIAAYFPMLLNDSEGITAAR
jgi:hypothetical protein